MKLYVDEDADEYYWHVPSTKDVTMICDRGKKFQHRGAYETYGSKLNVKDGPFKDNKLLRVQERGQQGDIHPLTRKRKNFLLKNATQQDWFELALRFGKELTPSQWFKLVKKHPKRKMVKLLGFDGGHPMVSSFVNDATKELLDADVVLWDGDWFCMQGWTGMIYNFLKAKKEATAVAFQKRAEVPGFHRSYWKLHQEFPNRIQIVVLKDAGYVCPQPILDRHEWLEKQFDDNKLERPRRADGDKDKYNKYLTTAMVGRNFQRETMVVAMNGGIIATALAALETGDGPFTQIQWTVYPAWRVKPEKSKTLVQYALENSHEGLNLVQQEGMSPLVLHESSCLAGACRMEQETGEPFVALHVRGDCGNEVNVVAGGGSGDCHAVSSTQSTAAYHISGISRTISDTTTAVISRNQQPQPGGGTGSGNVRMTLPPQRLGCQTPAASGLIQTLGTHGTPLCTHQASDCMQLATARPTISNTWELPSNPQSAAITVQRVSITQAHSCISHHPDNETSRESQTKPKRREFLDARISMTKSVVEATSHTVPALSAEP